MAPPGKERAHTEQMGLSQLARNAWLLFAGLKMVAGKKKATATQKTNPREYAAYQQRVKKERKSKCFEFSY